MRAKNSRLMPRDFVHLHNHTQYSLLDGLTKVPALIQRVKEMGMEAIAITDHGTMSGAIEFYKEATTNNIKPLIGMETYVAARSRKDKDPSKDKAYYHLILLAMNNTGYQNLMRLSTKANLEGFYYRPRIDRQLLEEHSEGLLVLSGCIGGEIGDMLRQDQYDQAKQTAAWYKSVFGDRYYLEVQDHGHKDHPHKWDEQIAVTDKTLQLAKELDIECVLTSDAHYLDHNDQEAHEILLCVQTGSFLSDEKRMSLKEFDLFITKPEELIGRWGETHPELILNTRRIADRCDVTLELGKILIPQFPVPKGESERTYLEKLVYRGLAWRYGNSSEAKAQKLSIPEAKKSLPKEVLDRAAYELTIIEQMGFCGYFLIISDFINWGKDKGIVFGPGRGSAAGSIIAYSLKITELDPLAYDLLFERFLNPDRISMPDIDIDIQDTRRDEVIQYCVEKYGNDRVANIVTFGRMAARNAVRDVARVLQVPYAEADRLAKMIPPPVQGRHVPLATSLQKDADLKHEYKTNETAKRVFDLAIQLEGTIRSHGVHAAGVVIAPDDIVKFVPLEMAQKGVVATQYSMGPIEDLGLLKMDFLGLSNLTIIKNALRIVKKVHHKDIDISKLALDDEKTFELFQRGDTTGVFQFESSGMKRYLKELKPTVFDDLIAMNALYRPGPMQWIEDFIERKHGRRSIEYLHEKTKNALENTYGILVYQEQVMQIAKDLCGFTGGQADTLRKGVAKKKPEVLAALKKDFIEGALKNSDVSKQKIEEFWKSLEAFAAYCFPKAHSSCYATIAYWTAYLKAHFPAAFMAALMTSDYDDTDRLAIEISECKHMGIKVLPPDVNESFAEFAVVPGKSEIRFSMAAVKNVGTGAVDEIIRARKESAFVSIEDFLSRVNVRIVNRKALESLIRAGALDRFASRSTLLHNMDLLVAFATRLQKQATSGQVDLFGAALDDEHVIPKLILEESAQHDTHEFLVWERELLGLYLSQHPLETYDLILEELCVPIHEVTKERQKGAVKIGGAVEDVREITTKNGQKMAFVRLVDMSGEIELVIFPSVYQLTLGLWERDHVVIVKGKLSKDTANGGGQGSELKVLVDEAREITPAQARAYQATGKKPKKRKTQLRVSEKPESLVLNATTPRLFVRVPSSEDITSLTTIKSVMDNSTGTTEVILVVGKDELQQAIRLPVRVEPNQALIEKISSLVGAENVKLS